MSDTRALDTLAEPLTHRLPKPFAQSLPKPFAYADANIDAFPWSRAAANTCTKSASRSWAFRHSNAHADADSTNAHADTGARHTRPYCPSTHRGGLCIR